MVEVSKARKGYEKSYKDEILQPKDLLVQLEASKSSIKGLFEDLLNKMKGFEFQITVVVLLGKRKEIRNIEYSPVYFNSATKTVINSEYNLDKYLQEILYRLGNWINEGSGWIVESKNGEYVNISIQRPLVGITYIELPNKL